MLTVPGNVNVLLPLLMDKTRSNVNLFLALLDTGYLLAGLIGQVLNSGAFYTHV